MGGLNILTDPHFSQRAFPVQWLGPRRKTPLPAQLAQLPRIDLVAISHSHFDHLDRDTVHALIAQAGEQPVFLAPLGVHRWLRDEGATRVETFDWWQSRDVLGIKVDFVPVHHWSQRSAFDRNRTLWGGWALRAPGFSFLFVGDTGYAPVFAEIGARFGGFDLAAVPIGAYEPRWFMKDQHVDPAEAVRIHRDVRARRSVAIHWGTFELTDEPLDAPMAALPAALDAAGLPRSDFFLMHHGETRRYPFQAQAPADHPVPSTRDPKQ
jgi:L-ascorbate metabolism protein UlaG (beta-lactamase superfamily)